MNRIFLYILPAILIIPSLTYADGPYLNIPPTNAFDKIHSDNGTIYAMNFSMPLNIKSGTGISVKSNNSTHTLTISNSALSSIQGTYNITQANNANINSGGNKINFINGTGATVHIQNSASGTQVNVTISSTGSGGTVTSVSGTPGNITSTGGATPVINTGDDIPHLSKFNNFTQNQEIKTSIEPILYLNQTTSTTNGNIIGELAYESLNNISISKKFFTLDGFVSNNINGKEDSGGRILVFANGIVTEIFRVDPTDSLIYDGAVVKIGDGARLLLPNMTQNTAITDPTAHAGWIWLSNTNQDVYKYSSGSTIYSIQSTKNFLNFTSSSNKTGVTGFNMLGDGITLTPAVTGRAEITVTGYGTQNTAASGGAVQIRQITGGCPANGATVTGTALGSNEKMTMSATTTKVPFSLTAQATGLAIGTKYCFELTQQSITSGTFTVFNVVWAAKEI